MFWILALASCVTAQLPTSPVRYTNCSAIPTGQEFSIYRNTAQAILINAGRYKRLCANIPDQPQGTCVLQDNTVVSQYDFEGNTIGLGPYTTTYDFNCTQCSLCQCPPGMMRGQATGECCGDVSGGPGCICARRSSTICLSDTGPAGQCVTSGFTLASDYSNPVSQTSIGLARARGLVGDGARTALVGIPSAILMLNVMTGFASRFKVGHSINFENKCESFGRASIFEDDVPQATILVFKYNSGSTPTGALPCMADYVLQTTVARYDANLGTIAIRNIGTQFSPVIVFLVPFLSQAGGITTDTLQVADMDNPPEITQGFFLVGFDGSAGVWAGFQGVSIYYLVTAIGATIIHQDKGTLLVLRTTSKVLDCNTLYCGFAMLSPAVTDPGLTRVPASFMSSLNYSLEMVPKLASSSQGDNVTVWMYLGAVRPIPNKYCNYVAWSLPAQYIMLVSLTDYLVAAPFRTEVTACQAAWTVCNGPISMTRIPLAGTTAISVDINYNKDTGDGATFPSATRYLTVVTAEVVVLGGDTTLLNFLAVEEGAPGGGLLGTQTGIDFGNVQPPGFSQLLTIFVTVTAQNIGGFPPNTGLGITYCAFLGPGPNTPCGVLELAVAGGGGACHYSPAAVLGPLPVEIADCDACAECACDILTAERGNGSLCCPPFHLGYQCSINTRTDCTTVAAGAICSENGNSTYPGNINGTGCYPNGNHYQCACLPEYAPPNCLLRYDVTCGFPLCSGHGNCTEASGSALDTHACICGEGYRGSHCQYPVTQCFTALDQPVCSGHGRCNDPDVADFGSPACICDDGHTGVYCEQNMFDSCYDLESGLVCTGTGVCIPTRRCTLPFPAFQVEGTANASFAFANFTGYAILAVLADVVGSQGSLVFGTIGVSPGHTATGIGPNVTVVTIADIGTQVSNQLSIINALPCTVTLSAFPTTAGPGVYCFASVTIANAVTLRAQSSSSVFIFRIAGSTQVATNAQFILQNNANPQNVFFTTPTLTIQPNARVVGTWVSGTATIGPTQMTGLIVTTGASSVIVRGATLLAPSPLTPESPCQPPVTSFDICDSTGLLDFCATKIGNGKSLGITSPAYIAQTFTLPEVECLSNPNSIVRGFTIMSNFRNFCITETAITSSFFLGTESLISNTYTCTTTLQRANGIIRLFMPSQQHSYAFNRLCFSTSVIDLVPSFRDSMKEAIMTRMRVGQTESTALEVGQRLLLACQRLAQQTRAPYYGIDSGVTRCWIPVVGSAVPSTPPSAALNGVRDFDYNIDIEDPSVVQFWYATTNSISS